MVVCPQVHKVVVFGPWVVAARTAPRDMFLFVEHVRPQPHDLISNSKTGEICGTDLMLAVAGLLINPNISNIHETRNQHVAIG